MTDARDGQVITFYSYKGGTGRTMALANVAWILAANGYRVLAVDWDLESPGLHRFFAPFIDRAALDSTRGVTELIREYEWATTRDIGRSPHWHEDYARVHKYSFSLNWLFKGGGSLDFLSAGQPSSDYASTVAGMNWDDFYDRQGGGLFFDALRADMKKHYDYTLIDSRTGRSDVAEICTIHLPDTLVACFTLSEQGIDGAAQVARQVENRYGSRHIRTLPVPMRIDGAEKLKADTGRLVARQRFAGLPSGMTDVERDAYWIRMQVPYQAFYAYEEVLATFGDLPGVNGSLLSAYELLTEEITGGAVRSLPPMGDGVRARINAAFMRSPVPVETELVLRHAPEDRVWAEWITHVLVSAGVRVMDPWFTELDEAGLGSTRELTVISEANAGDEATLVLPDRALDRAPLAVYVEELARPANIPAAGSVSITGLTADAAAARILELVGRESAKVDPEVSGGPRFPGRENIVQELPGRNPRFTGREDDLRHIRRMFRKAPTVVLATGGQVALQGMGGIGKSQLALEYAHRFHLAYDVVWWIDADRVGGIEESLGDLGLQLSVPMAGSSQDIARAVLHALRHTEHRWLLVLDNAEDVPGVSQFLPAGKGHVLITSRSSLWGERVTPVTVDVFKRAESIQHLSGRVPTIRVDEADQIARLLGDLPIAVAAAAAWLADTGHSVDDYLSEIAKYGPSILVEPQTNLTVEATWDLSLALLRERSPAAYRLLQLCSIFAPEISLDLVYSDAFAAALIPLDPQASEELVRAQLVQQVNRLSLLRVDLRGDSGFGGDRGRNGLVLMHRLLQHAVRSRMTSDQLDEARRQVHLVLARARPKGEVDNPETWPRLRTVWPHLEVSKAAQSHEESVRNLLIDQLRYLWVRGDLENGRRFGQEISKIWTAMLLDTDLKEAGVLRRQLLHLQFNLGNILSYQGRFEESRLLDEEVLESQRALLSPDHPHTLMTAGGLARDLRGLGRYREALKLDLVTYNAWRDQFGEEHPRTLAALNNLATSQRLMGDFREARRNDELVLRGRTKVLGDIHPETFASANNLGRDIRDAGEYATSVARLRRVYTGLLQTLGGDALQTLRVQSNLAVSLRSAGRSAEAGEMLETAYERLNEIFGPDNPDTLTCRLSLSVNLLAVDLDQRAGRELQAVHDIYRRNLGPDHPQTLVCVLDLAMVARRIGDSRRARELAGAAAERFTDVLGDQHPYALSARMNEAICIAEDTDPPEGRDGALRVARDALENVSARMDEVLGPTHPNALRCRANVVLARSRDGDGQEREIGALMRELATRIGDHHPAVVALRERRFLHRIIDPHPF